VQGCSRELTGPGGRGGLPDGRVRLTSCRKAAEVGHGYTGRRADGQMGRQEAGIRLMDRYLATAATRTRTRTVAAAAGPPLSVGRVGRCCASRRWGWASHSQLQRRRFENDRLWARLPPSSPVGTCRSVRLSICTLHSTLCTLHAARCTLSQRLSLPRPPT
jgi:hypothetical protein